jgi:hypothetical protein
MIRYKAIILVTKSLKIKTNINKKRLKYLIDLNICIIKNDNHAYFFYNNA